LGQRRVGGAWGCVLEQTINNVIPKILSMYPIFHSILMTTISNKSSANSMSRMPMLLFVKEEEVLDLALLNLTMLPIKRTLSRLLINLKLITESSLLKFPLEEPEEVVVVETVKEEEEPEEVVVETAKEEEDFLTMLQEEEILPTIPTKNVNHHQP